MSSASKGSGTERASAERRLPRVRHARGIGCGRRMPGSAGDRPADRGTAERMSSHGDRRQQVLRPVSRPNAEPNAGALGGEHGTARSARRSRARGLRVEAPAETLSDGARVTPRSGEKISLASRVRSEASGSPSPCGPEPEPPSDGDAGTPGSAGVSHRITCTHGTCPPRRPRARRAHRPSARRASSRARRGTKRSPCG